MDQINDDQLTRKENTEAWLHENLLNESALSIETNNE